MDYDGHWWNDPFGLTKILRSQGVLDEDEFVHDTSTSTKPRRTCEVCFQEADDVELVQTEIVFVKVFICAACRKVVCK